MSESNMGSLLENPIQLLEESLIVEMNIDEYTAVRKFQCCDAANRETHGFGND
jgi:hypothetical protein